MSQHKVWLLLCELLDPEDEWWWTGVGLIALSDFAKTHEGRFWATVYLRLREAAR